jgi:uncharacterized protein
MNSQRFERREPLILENGGQQLFGVAHFPLISSREQQIPAVLICHGFGGNKIGQGRMYVILAEKLAKAGIAALRVDFRGCGDSEGQFGELTMEGLVSDAVLALQYLSDHQHIDASRIGIVGSSLGGPVAIYAAQKTQIPTTMALWAAVASGKRWRSDWETHCGNESLENRLRSGGQPVSEHFREQFLALEADVLLANMPLVSVLNIHGNKDVTVFPTHVQDYRTARLQAQSLTEFIELPNSDHHFTLEDERNILIDETAKWFQKRLLR